jgi:hypothetical protein
MFMVFFLIRVVVSSSSSSSSSSFKIVNDQVSYYLYRESGLSEKQVDFHSFLKLFFEVPWLFIITWVLSFLIFRKFWFVCVWG